MKDSIYNDIKELQESYNNIRHLLFKIKAKASSNYEYKKFAMEVASIGCEDTRKAVNKLFEN